MDKEFYNIIKYNTRRQYFGLWSPKTLHETFHTTQKNPESGNQMHIGMLSTDDICKTLLNEMAYNPLRFGTNNPFNFFGYNSIRRFCDKYRDSAESFEAEKVFCKIAISLRRFLKLMNHYDPYFDIFDKMKTQTINIQLFNGSSNIGYKILSCLVECVHIIASQNMQDFKRSAKYRNEIKRVIISRHPDLRRPDQKMDFETLAKIKNQESNLYDKIAALQDDIQRINMNINDLNELENPGDTSKQQYLLQQKQKQLEQTEQKYTEIYAKKQKILESATYYNMK